MTSGSLMDDQQNQTTEPTGGASVPTQSGIPIKKLLRWSLMLLGMAMAVGLISIVIGVWAAFGNDREPTPGLAGTSSGGGGELSASGISNTPELTSCVNDHLKSQNAAMKDSNGHYMGSIFINAGVTASVNPALMIAIGQHESSLGTAGIASHGDQSDYVVTVNGVTYYAKYNFYGKTARDNEPYITSRGVKWRAFSDWDNSITEQAQYLQQEYLSQGKTTIPLIQAKYAPSGASNDPTGLNSEWVKGVTAAFNDLTTKCPALRSSSSSISDNSIVQAAWNEYDKYRGRQFTGDTSPYAGIGDPWCAGFVSYVLKQSGYDDGGIVAVEGLKKWLASHGTMKARGEFDVSYLQPGDIFIKQSNGISHTGIVTNVTGGQITTIQGNTSKDEIAIRPYSIQDFMNYADGVGRIVKQ